MRKKYFLIAFLLMSTSWAFAQTYSIGIELHYQGQLMGSITNATVKVNGVEGELLDGAFFFNLTAGQHEVVITNAPGYANHTEIITVTSDPNNAFFFITLEKTYSIGVELHYAGQLMGSITNARRVNFWMGLFSLT